ncbi:MAG: AAA family ATPase, partial [Pseudomonadota bacterium]
MDTGLTTIDEKDINKHLPTAQSLVTKLVLLEVRDNKSKTEIAGTRRRFVSTVSTSGAKSTREVEFTNTLSAVTSDDNMLSPVQHGILFKTRRALAVALAVADEFAQQTGLDALRSKNASSALEGDEATQYRTLLEASGYVAAFAAAAYLHQFVETAGEPANDVEEPNFNFDTPQDALKSFVGGLDVAASDAADDTVLQSRVRALADIALEELLQRKGRFSG